MACREGFQNFSLKSKSEIPGSRWRNVCSVNSKSSSVSLFATMMLGPKKLSRARAIASLPILVGFNSLLLCCITTSKSFSVSFVDETGGF